MKAVDYTTEVIKKVNACKGELEAAKDMAEKPDNKEHIQSAHDHLCKAVECLEKYVD